MEFRGGARLDIRSPAEATASRSAGRRGSPSCFSPGRNGPRSSGSRDGVASALGARGKIRARPVLVRGCATSLAAFRLVDPTCAVGLPRWRRAVSAGGRWLRAWAIPAPKDAIETTADGVQRSHARQSELNLADSKSYVEWLTSRIHNPGATRSESVWRSPEVRWSCSDCGPGVRSRDGDAAALCGSKCLRSLREILISQALRPAPSSPFGGGGRGPYPSRRRPDSGRGDGGMLTARSPEQTAPRRTPASGSKILVARVARRSRGVGPCSYAAVLMRPDPACAAPTARRASTSR